MSLRKYYAAVRMGFVKSSVYRLEFLMSMLSSVVALSLFYFIWSSIASSGTLESSVTEIMSYLVLARAVSAVAFSRTEQKVGDRVRQGTVVNELKRPFSFPLFILLREIGGQGIEFITKSLPLLALGMIFFGVAIPEPLVLLQFTAALILSALLGLLIGLNASMIVFWTKTANGLSMARSLIQNFFSGVYFPLFLLPAALTPVFNLLPFQAIVDGPISIFLGRISGKQVLYLYLKQIFWLLFFTVLCIYIWRKAKKKLTVQGG